MMQSRKNFDKNSLFRILLFILALGVITYFYPDKANRDYKYSIGKPWSYPLLTAPFDMPILLDSTSMAVKKDSIDRTFVPYFKIDEIAQKTVYNHVRGYYKMSVFPGELKRVEDHLRHLYAVGIVENDIYAKINSGKLPKIKVLNNNQARLVDTRGMFSVKTAYAYLDSAMSGSANVRSMNLSSVLTPNMLYDQVNSSKFLEDMYRASLASPGIIQRGERIVDRGEIVTPQIALMLHSYQTLKKQHANSSVKVEAHYPIAGYALIIAFLLLFLYLFLSMHRTSIFYSNRKLTFVVALVTIFSISASTLFSNIHASIYFIPISLVTILLTTFFDSRTAFFVSVVQVLICSLMVEFNLEFIFLHLVACVIAIDTLQELSRRSQLIRTAFFILIGYSMVYVAINILMEGNLKSVNPRTFMYFGVNAIMLSFAYVLIFILEKMFGFVSKVTLVELSDVNNPLLRELSEKCPGTFQHSLQLSNLVSEAAHEIGANTQLARAGALYHDIGKMENPAFFTENQMDVNPHEVLTPEQSAKIVVRHVADGLKRAEKAKLPMVIRDFISQHHGKNLAQYFYTTACNNNGGEPVDPEPYRYPGPNPQTKETAILMMADATEAASRSLKEYSEETITALVNKIVDGQIAKGLLKEAPLSFRDVEKVKCVFISRLKTMYHARVSYPELIKKED